MKRFLSIYHGIAKRLIGRLFVLPLIIIVVPFSIFLPDIINFTHEFKPKEEVEISPIQIEKFDIGEEYLNIDEGKASYYGSRFHNRKTANGERFNKYSFTAAHRNLPFGTIVRVTNLANGKGTIVRINDRGPYIRKRIIDVSKAAALHIEKGGVSRVRLEYFNKNDFECYDSSCKNSYVIYSLDSYPMLLSEDLIRESEKYSDFNSAISKLHLLIAEGKRAYLAIDVNIYKDFGRLENEEYLIVTLKETELKELNLARNQ